ncbi:glucan endo-1,3-beta-glucosidase isoform 1 [Hibiscus syriacus]|uniref:Glucan endo-1,3-beta-glucosidase isoform 1 n=1 Tax=Hibiscus syriacus TaxID=106335 RepID=A0A6A3AH70_HIBSY|nr:uncharacterized protein LOC120128768 [Hibiscus syriacus]KAE8702585.1 glucan endo-1,3-beta-glucosidase isoform 1 [Hibiscus syriacus]
MEKKNNKKQKYQHPNDQAAKSPAPSSDFSFKPSNEVKGLRFGGQFIVKSFTIRRARPPELLKLLDFPPLFNKSNTNLPFPTITAFLPTNFNHLSSPCVAHADLGLGTKKSKVDLFVFKSEAMKVAVDKIWPPEIPLGEVNKKLTRGLKGFEMARFKFRKGYVTF